MTEPPALPQHTASPRPAEPPATDALDMDSAVREYGISVSTLRRRLRAGDLAGAYKVPGPKGDEWRIPRGSLDTAFGERERPQEPEPTLDQGAVLYGPAGALERALDALTDVTGQLASTQRQLMAAEQDRGAHERQLLELTERAVRAEGERDALRAHLAEQRRRFFWPFRPR